MEEVDAILLTQLRDIGCDLDDDIDGIMSLDSLQVMKCVSQCLNRIITDDDDLCNIPKPNMISPAMNMSNKYKYAAQLSSFIQNLGYKSDIGYQTFMYSNEHEIRQLLLFLIEHISRDNEDEDKTFENSANDSLSSISIVQRLRSLNLSTIWIPRDSFCDDTEIIYEYKYCPESDYFDQYSSRFVKNYTNTASSLGFSIKSFLTNSHSMSLQKYSKFKLSNQCYEDANSILPSSVMDILEMSNQFFRYNQFDDDDDEDGSSIDLYDKFISLCTTTPKSKAVSMIQHQDSIESNQSSKSSVRVNQESVPIAEVKLNKKDLKETTIEKLKNRLHNYDEKIIHLKSEESELINLESEYQEKCKYFEASYKSLEELEKSISTIKGQIEEIATTWEDIQSELLSDLKAKKSQNNAQSHEYREKVKEINELKKSITLKLKDIQSKKSLINELETKIPQQWPPGRSSYTRRIIEIITNVKKQNEETKKVLFETRSIQKDINILNGKIERIFTVADEIIFREAKLNEWNRKCYKSLALLQTTFTQLLEAISNIGVHLREIRHLEEMVDNEKTKNTVSNLTRIRADLQQIKLENDQLKVNIEKKLSKLNGST